MTDIVSPEKRAEMMSLIGSKNTRPEKYIRSMLHKSGYRFRINYKKLPGKPDVVLPKHRTIVDIRGCFWHQHECSLFKWPSTRPQFWREKLQANKQRDAKLALEYSRSGWSHVVVWECATKGRYRMHPDTVLKSLSIAIESSTVLFLELAEENVS